MGHALDFRFWILVGGWEVGRLGPNLGIGRNKGWGGLEEGLEWSIHA